MSRFSSGHRASAQGEQDQAIGWNVVSSFDKHCNRLYTFMRKGKIEGLPDCPVRKIPAFNPSMISYSERILPKSNGLNQIPKGGR
jgi:hypothetical protein